MAVPRFTVVVLARDEARTLPLLLNGLAPFVERGGEVLVVDTGSSDDTIAVAQALRCRVVSVGERFAGALEPAAAGEIERRFARNGEGPLVTAGQRLFHFAAARQHAGMLAANEWVLQVDASDEVEAMDVDALDRRIESGASSAFEYEVGYGSMALRFSRFYDRSRHHWEGRAHEALMVTTPGDPGTATRRCSANELRLRHHKQEKTRGYLAGLALQVIEAPEKVRWWHYLGRELYYMGCHRSAIEVLEVHAGTETAWAAERSQSLCFAGECHERMGHAAEAEQCYRRAFAIDPTRREPLLRLATMLCQRGDFEETVRLATRALAIPHTSAFAEIEANYTWVPHSLLYWSLFWLDRRDEARAHWETYRSLAPEGSINPAHARLFPPATAA